MQIYADPFTFFFIFYFFLSINWAIILRVWRALFSIWSCQDAINDSRAAATEVSLRPAVIYAGVCSSPSIPFSSRHRRPKVRGRADKIGWRGHLSWPLRDLSSLWKSCLGASGSAVALLWTGFDLNVTYRKVNLNRDHYLTRVKALVHIIKLINASFSSFWLL